MHLHMVTTEALKIHLPTPPSTMAATTTSACHHQLLNQISPAMTPTTLTSPHNLLLALEGLLYATTTLDKGPLDLLLLAKRRAGASSTALPRPTPVPIPKEEHRPLILTTTRMTLLPSTEAKAKALALARARAGRARPPPRSAPFAATCPSSAPSSLQPPNRLHQNQVSLRCTPSASLPL